MKYWKALILWVIVVSCVKSHQTVQHTRQSEGVPSARRGEVLFLGHQSKHHDSGKYAPWLAIKLFRSGVNMSYTTDLADLNTENLSKFDGLIIYANHDSLPPQQEAALKAFVDGGKGLIPIHSASGCFRNSDWYISAIGGQFASHGTGSFANTILQPQHPVLKGITPFETWDETYVHQRLNPDNLILGERVDGTHHEPYTWVRTQGKGRVFYTAYGHEDKTWTNIGFLNLVRNGVLWAIGDRVSEQIAALDIPDPDIYESDTIAGFTQRHVVPQEQVALSPAQSSKLIQVPADFEIQLFAAEPDIQNPISMAWDERGRLWVVESVDYPNTFKETDGQANDRIKICEDTDGDGKADKFTVFADGLNIPTSMVFSQGGVIVSMAPDFVFLKDTNGDDVADVRRVIMTGWGKNDTHAGPSHLQYGFDNKIWGVNGYSGFDGVVDGQKLKFPQGVYHFNPDGSDFAFLGNTSNNTWGLGFTEDNNVFLSTANNTHSAFYSMPARYMQRRLEGEEKEIQSVQKIDGHYDAHAMTPNLRQVDVVGGFTAASGHHFYTARDYPKSYWNRVAFVSEPTVRLVHHAIIEKDGAGFKESDGWNLMASSDEWFGPVHAEVGPDGAVWVADWYNFIIQHNVFVPRQSPSEFILPFTEQPHGQGNAFESQMRDTNHGRVYRVVYKKAVKKPQPRLSIEDKPGLLAALRNDNMFWRMTAQRLLVESGDRSVAPVLYQIIGDKAVDSIGLNSPAVHALWTLHGLGMLDGSHPEAVRVVVQALKHPAAGVRKAAVDVLPRNRQSFDAMVPLLKDTDLNTRLAALVSLIHYPADPAIGEALYNATKVEENAADPWIAKALLAAAIAQEEGFLAAAIRDNSPTAFAEKIRNSLRQEVYHLGRRTTMQFAPDVTGKEIALSVLITKDQDYELEGFIMGQGDATAGYALYIANGRVVVQVNQHGMQTKVQSDADLPEKFEVLARLDNSGKLTLEIDGELAATGNTHGLFRAPLPETVRSGEDRETKIGAYPDKFSFRGSFQKAKLMLNRPEVSQSPVTVIKKSTFKPTTDVEVIELSVVPEMLQYSKTLIKVKAGQKVAIILENPDGMQHNMLIARPGTLETVGKAADALLTDPQAAQRYYVPDIPEVLFSTKLVNSGETVTLEFTVPAEPGDYPFVCTFPGHWRGMNGILRVVK
ncbi:putative membrane-bound dehydrogenase-like protein [Dyadobacter jejuensis]|uniref:Putative membrane-bound dehydrogenase-like protein n=1 Tax=Dyadobacter jejuensis TaxID=1082580 RepID=A0A316AHB5_9BACT|nr:PVC-type heme-binding CxxCH protein [Dyadobacter jejuensis]PWJ57166.1 putative membrane-bound dehydrogenase-like protein [Dyadobacter jejuensis]